MKHTYILEGATCSSCKAKVEAALLDISQIEKVVVADDLKTVAVQMTSHVSLDDLNKRLDTAFPGKYTMLVREGVDKKVVQQLEPALPEKTLKTYYPLLLVLGYIVIGTFFAMLFAADWTITFAMRVFMGLFFLGFSFFKLLDIPGFAMSYLSYDVIAARWLGWGYVYPFVELLFGVLYLSGWQQLWLHIAVVLVMSVSLVGVVKSVLNKKKIRCACLGTGFNLPMSTVTIIEDAGMVLMALVMIYNLVF